MKKPGSRGQKPVVSKRSESAEIEELIGCCSQSIESRKMQFFSELPISEKTKSGLTNANFLEMTDIQKASLGKSLVGCDILGAAKTGSGKTLAFLIPVIELLYRQKWSHMDGLGALIISPTRELALQIFGVLRKIGKNHTLSAGLIIGGKDWEYEKGLINRMSILVCTPGRLLQHMDQTPNFNCDNLQILVLDEADRILDMGFKKTVNAIIENLPLQRQTLLFSATQTKSVSDLARLSLKDPEYIAVHEKASASTPETLSQNYLVCQLYEKLDILYSFVRTHLHAKCLVFLSSCKQVRFVYESFCKLQPGTVVMCLHGKQKQSRRNIMFEKFCRAKAAVMICTDIAARGLDFPAVDWVIQADCPEDADSYIHRVGRTARFKSNGKALLFLLPSEEEGMSSLFERRKIPITKIAVNPSKTASIIPKLQGLCVESKELKYLAEKAFICYLRSIWLQKDKGIFRISEMPLEEFAASLGLPGAPNIKFIRKFKTEKNRQRNLEKAQNDAKVALGSEEEDEDGSEDASESSDTKPTIKSQPTSRMDRMFNKKNQAMLWEHNEKLKTRDEDIEEDSEDGGDQRSNGEEDDGDLFKLVRKNHDIEGVPTTAPGFDERPLSVRDQRKLKKKNRIQTESSGVRLIFDEDGKPELSWKLETENDFAKDDQDVFMKHKKYLDATTEVMKQADAEDKQLQRQRLREKKQAKKRKLRSAENGCDDNDGPIAVLGGAEKEHNNEEYESTDDASDYMNHKRRHVAEDCDDENDAMAFDFDEIETSAPLAADEEEFALRLISGGGA